MSEENYILSYYQKIKDGSITVGRWIHLVMEVIVHGLEDGRFVLDNKKANNAIKFIEAYCHHSEGRADRLRLELWQKAFISCMFGVLDKDGNRQFREVVLIIGRKNGKTLLASAIMAYMAFADGEYGPKIFCLAPKLDQATLVYDSFKNTILSEPRLEKRTKIRADGIYVPDNGKVKRIAFNAKKSDGFNPSLTVCDEIASWPGEAGLRQYEVMKSALAARRSPIVLSISTSGYVNGGIFDELIKRSTRFLLGDSKESRLLPFLYMIDDVQKWNDINELRKSNPNLGVSVSVDYLLEEIAVAEGSLSKKAEFLCKYCNIKQNSSQAWLSTQDVGKASSDRPLQLEDFKKSYCVGGIDLSRTTDLSAAVVLIEKDGELYCFSKFWLPSEKIEEATARDGLPYAEYIRRGLLDVSGDNVIDYEDCHQWFLKLVNEYSILPLQVGYDRYCAAYLVNDMKQDGFHMDDVFQGYNLSPVIREMEGIIKDGRLHIGDNDLMKIHLLNTALKVDAESDKCKIIKMAASDHIDGCAALLDALCVRQKWYGEIGNQLKNGG